MSRTPPSSPAKSVNVGRMGAFVLACLLSGNVGVARAAPPPPPSDTCAQGYVWREAVPNDHVCVTPLTRSQTADDNAQAHARIAPHGGPYGPDTCLQGYVWRDAVAGDHVCVTPATRSLAASDNNQANERIASSQTRNASGLGLAATAGLIASAAKAAEASAKRTYPATVIVGAVKPAAVNQGAAKLSPMAPDPARIPSGHAVPVKLPPIIAKFQAGKNQILDGSAIVFLQNHTGRALLFAQDQAFNGSIPSVVNYMPNPVPRIEPEATGEFYIFAPPPPASTDVQYSVTYTVDGIPGNLTLHQYGFTSVPNGISTHIVSTHNITTKNSDGSQNVVSNPIYDISLTPPPRPPPTPVPAPVPTNKPPTITPAPQNFNQSISVSSSGQGSGATFHIVGSGFHSGQTVTVRVVDDYPGGDPTLTYTTTASGTGTVVLNQAIACNSGLALHFSATDSRSDPSQVGTGVGWSNTFTLPCP